MNAPFAIIRNNRIHSSMQPLHLASLALLTLLSGGCLGEVAIAPLPLTKGPPPTAGPSMEPGFEPSLEPTLASILSSFPEPMEKLNEQPMESVIAPGTFLDLWVGETGRALYAQARLAESGTRMVLPVGTTVLRVLRDAQGNVTKYTVLTKREPGFNPPSDLWFAVYRADGALAWDAGGAPMAGKLESCTNCHLSRANDGYVFGRVDR